MYQYLAMIVLGNALKDALTSQCYKGKRGNPYESHELRSLRQQQWGSPSSSDPRAKNTGQRATKRDRADVTEFVTLVRLSSLGQHVDVGVLALAGYKRRKWRSDGGPYSTPR